MCTIYVIHFNVIDFLIDLCVQCFQLSLATFVVFATKTVILEAFVLKPGENVGTSFIFSLANFGRSSLNVYVVIIIK